MNQRQKRIAELIENGIESDIVDFKQQYYHEAKKSEFIKDIISFANASLREDKYIVFGVSDATRETIGITENDIPDISNLNQLIRTYCDPFIEIDIEQFDIDGKRVGAVIVKSTNIQKPYVVAKDFSFKDKICLRAGDIYVRKSANNFRALRSDIEEIYKTRFCVDILSLNNKIEIGIVDIARVKQVYARIPISFVNNSDNSFVFGKATVKWMYADNKIGSSVLYIEDNKTQFRQVPTVIEKSPFMLPSKSQAEKTLFLKVSDSFYGVIRERTNMHQELKVEVVLYDACNTEYKTSFVVDTILWE